MVIEIIDVESEKELLVYDFEARVESNNNASDEDRLDDICLLAEFNSLNKREGDIIINEKETFVVATPPETNLDTSTITIWVEKLTKKKKKVSRRPLGK